MKVIPAIDIRRSKVVRLTQGDAKKETVYFDSPIEVAKSLALSGVELIHVVDLDGAIGGRPRNLDIIKEMAGTIKPKIEMGGGIRDEKTVEAILESGIAKVVIGTKAIEEKFLSKIAKKFSDRIVVGIDARAGLVYTKGWLFKTDTNVIEFAKSLEGAGIRTINYTDISKDGMLQGPNIESLRELLAAVKIDVIAAGGVSSIEDLKILKSLEPEGLKGVIIGKALYEGRIDLGEAIRICQC